MSIDFVVPRFKRKRHLPGVKLVLALQNTNSPSLWEWGLGFVGGVMMSWVMIQVYPKLG